MAPTKKTKAKPRVKDNSVQSTEAPSSSDTEVEVDVVNPKFLEMVAIKEQLRVNGGIINAAPEPLPGGSGVQEKTHYALTVVQQPEMMDTLMPPPTLPQPSSLVSARSPQNNKRGLEERCSAGSTSEAASKCMRVSPVADRAEKKEVPPKEVNKSGWVQAIKSVSLKVMGVVLNCDSVDKRAAEKLIGLSAEYEAIIMSLVEENASLRGKVEGLQEAIKVKGEIATVGRPSVGGAGQQGRAPAPVVVALPEKPAPKPVETWSLVVRSRNSAVSSSDIVSKVVGEVGPTLGVRVHDVKPIRSGGAIIRTPSKAEREKVAKNTKFQELGFDVSVNEKGPRVVVQGVHSQIAPDEFMRELYEMNYKDSMTPEDFKKGVRLAGKPWEQIADKTTNVVLEGSGDIYCSFDIFSSDLENLCLGHANFSTGLTDIRSWSPR